jgi:hypothetical protein
MSQANKDKNTERKTQSNKIKKVLLRTLQPEFKRSFVWFNGSLPTSGPTIYETSDIVQGSGPTQRLGNKILYKILHYRGFFQWNNMGDIVASTNIRVILYADRQSNNAPPSVTDVLEDATLGRNLVSPINPDNRHRYWIIKDWQFSVDQYNPVVKMCHTQYMNCPVHYSTAFGDVSARTQMSFYVMVMHDTDGRRPYWTANIDIRYTDA